MLAVLKKCKLISSPILLLVFTSANGIAHLTKLGQSRLNCAAQNIQNFYRELSS